jgi:hypothetical protein
VLASTVRQSHFSRSLHPGAHVLIGPSCLADRSHGFHIDFLDHDGTYLAQRAPHAVTLLCRRRYQRRFADDIFGTMHCMHDIDHATPCKRPQLTNNWIFTFPQTRTISNQLVSVRELFVYKYFSQLLSTSFLQKKEYKLAQSEGVNVGDGVQC